VKARAEAKALIDAEGDPVLVELFDNYVGAALLGEDTG
jgi:hypothetical protein